MKIFDALKARIKLIVSPNLTQQFYASNSSKMRAIAQDVKDPFLQNPWVYSAITSIAQSVASVRFQIMSTNSGKAQESRRAKFQRGLAQSRKKFRPNSKKEYGEDEGDPVTSGPFYDLFHSPNPVLSASQLWEDTATFFKTQGEAAWVLESATNARLAENEIPSEIWPIDPRSIKETVSKDTGLIIFWTMRATNPATGQIEELMLDPWQVILFKTFNPYSRYRGMNPLTAAMQGINQDYKASAYNEAFYDNRGEPGGLLTTDSDLTEEQAKQLRRLWEDRHVGEGKAFRVAILHNGMKYQEVKAFSHQDMAFLDQRKWNREEVLAVLKVPKMIVGLYEDLNYATSQTAQALFWENAILPMLANFEDTLMLRLFIPLTQENDWGVFDLSCVEALRDDLEQKVKIAEAFLRMGYSTNEINERLEMGFPEIETGDESFYPSSLMPAGSIDLSMFETEGEETTPEPATKPNPAASPAVPVAASLDHAMREKALRVRERIEKVYNPGETIVLGKVKKYLFQLRTETLKRLDATTAHRKAEGPPLLPEDIENILFIEQEWDKRLREMMDPAYKKVMALSWNKTAEELGSSLAFNLQDPRILNLMGRKLASLVRVNASLRKRIRSSLISSLSKGETVTETAKELRTMFNRMSAGQALTIARTETGFAANGAQAELYRQEGVELVTWGTAEDEIVRDSHVTAGNSPPIRFMFDTFPNGLHYPLEMGAPVGEVANCRCSLDAYIPE